MVTNKNISDKNYFENYFRRCIKLWQATSEDVINFININSTNRKEIESFIDKNKMIKSSTGTSKNSLFVSIIKDNIPKTEDKLENLIMKLILYADKFQEKDKYKLFSIQNKLFSSIIELIHALNSGEIKKTVLKNAYNKSESYYLESLKFLDLTLR